MIKVELWIDDGREEVTTLVATAAPAEAEPPRKLSWELLHERFVARLHEQEKEG